MTITYSVHNYQTGAALTGDPSDELVEASLAERSGTGAVGAYRDTNGVWQCLREDEMSAYAHARVVYVTGTTRGE